MAHAASPLGPCAPFNQSLARLQAETGSGQISGSTGLLDGTLKLHADPALQVGGALAVPGPGGCWNSISKPRGRESGSVCIWRWGSWT